MQYWGSLSGAIYLTLFLLTAFSGVAFSQESQPAVENATAPVMLDGETLFELRGSSSFPAEMRANRVAGRIVAAAESPSYSSANLTLRPVDSGYELRSGSYAIFSIYEADARVEDLEIEIYAETIRKRVAAAIEAYREARSSKGVGYAILLALAATLVFGLFLVALKLLWRLASRLLDRLLNNQMKGLAEKANKVGQLQQLSDALQFFLKLLLLCVGLIALYYYITTVLHALPWTRGIAAGAFKLLTAPLFDIGLSIVHTIPNLVALSVIFIATRYTLKLSKRFFYSVHIGRILLPNFEREWAIPTERLMRLGIIIFAIIMAYPYIPGSQSAAFKGISIFAGVILSLGSSSIVANLIAGYSLIYRRAFQVGDRVKVAGVVGDVEEMRLQATHLITPKNERVTLPNSTILSTDVINYSTLAKDKGLILHTEVGIGYEVPWRQVEKLLLKAAAMTEGVLTNPAPFVLQTRLGDFAPVYELNAYTQDEKSMVAIYSKLHANIQDVFAEAKVQIMTPNYVSDPGEEKIPPPLDAEANEG
jgi:small-conductance mechanosensitive channel